MTENTSTRGRHRLPVNFYESDSIRFLSCYGDLFHASGRQLHQGGRAMTVTVGEPWNEDDQ